MYVYNFAIKIFSIFDEETEKDLIGSMKYLHATTKYLTKNVIWLRHLISLTIFLKWVRMAGIAKNGRDSIKRSMQPIS